MPLGGSDGPSRREEIMKNQPAQSLFRAARLTIVEISPGRFVVRMSAKRFRSHWSDYEPVWIESVTPRGEVSDLGDMELLLAAVLTMRNPQADA